MSIFLIVAFAGSAAFFIGVVLCSPRLLFRPLLRSAMWTLRDEIAASRRHDELPYLDLAPVALIHRIEAAIGASDEMSPAKMCASYAIFRRISEDQKRQLMAELFPDTGNLLPPELKLLNGYEQRYRHLIVAQTLLGSWSGLFVVFGGIPVLGAALVSVRFAVRLRRVASEKVILGQEIALELAAENQRELASI